MAGLVAAWVVAAVVLSVGDDDDAGEAASSETTQTTARPSSSTSSTRRTTTSTTSTTIRGAPLLGAPSGLQVLVGASGSQVVDLDTGVVRRTESTGEVITTSPTGVFTRGGTDLAGGSRVTWHRFPLEQTTAVDLGAGNGVQPVPGTDLAWLDRPLAPDEPRVLSLVSLTDGVEVSSATLPGDSWLVGATPEHAVIGASGNTFLVDAHGVASLLFDGQPVAVAGDDVIASACDADLRCGLVAVDTGTGRAEPVSGIEGSAWGDAGAPEHPDGRAVLRRWDTGFDEAMLVGRDGAVPLLPDTVRADSLYSSAWTPDGSLLLVQESGRLVVVDPFAAGGPVERTSFRVSAVDFGPLAVFAAS